jgi:diacylglycerol kinase (ATP)
MEPTLIILNPHAAGGRAGRLWHKIEPLLWQELGELVIAVTQHPDEVASHLDKARAAGLRRVIAIGGDGTNYALVNALIELNRQHPDEPPMTFGSLPMGTGRDWARTLGIPFDITEAVKWIKGAHPTPIDIGTLNADGHDINFLNIGSAGIGGVVDQRVNMVRKRRPWTYYKAIVETLISFRAPRLRVWLDDQLWYDDRAMIVTVANGRYFGHGLKIAPDANTNDGLFDVVAIDNLGRLEAVRALGTLYSGEHIKRDDVHVARARTVTIEGDSVIPIDLDGESVRGNPITFRVLPKALNMLTQPALGMAT